MWSIRQHTKPLKSKMGKLDKGKLKHNNEAAIAWSIKKLSLSKNQEFQVQET